MVVFRMPPLAKVRNGVGVAELRNFTLQCVVRCNAKCSTNAVGPALHGLHEGDKNINIAPGCSRRARRVNVSATGCEYLLLEHIYLTMGIMTVDSEGRPNGQNKRITKEMNGPKGTSALAHLACRRILYAETWKQITGAGYVADLLLCTGHPYPEQRPAG